MSSNNSKKRRSTAAPLVVFLLLLLFWVPFSGHFDAFHLTLGVLSCALVALLSHKLLFDRFSEGGKLKKTGRFIAYMPWLMWQIVLSNLHVAYLVFRPGKIAPQVVELDTNLRSDMSKVTLANSITLTPGTVTMEITGGKFYVHALDGKTADDVRGGEMERRAARVFMEE